STHFSSKLLEDLVPFLAKGGAEIAELGFYVVGGGWLALAAREALVSGGVAQARVLGKSPARTIVTAFAGGDRFIVGTVGDAGAAEDAAADPGAGGGGAAA